MMVSIVLELLSDKNPNIRVLVNAILDYVQIHDDSWKQEIKAKRFQVHNQVYMQLMEDYDKQNPIMNYGQDMYDEEMQYYDQEAYAQAQELAHAQALQEQQQYAQENGYYDEDEEYGAEGHLNGLYMDSLQDRIWGDTEE